MEQERYCSDFKADTDKDGLSDREEIDTKRIKWDYGGEVELPTIAECISYTEKPYALLGRIALRKVTNYKCNN